MIRILIADDHTLIRAGIRRIISDEKDMEVVAEAGTGREAARLCAELNPDVLVLDYEMPDMDGLEATSHIADNQPGIRILILTMHDSGQYALRFMQAGAAGFIPKEVSPEELPEAIRRVHAGKMYLTSSMANKFSAEAPSGDSGVAVSSLSDRELQVLIRLAKGHHMNEIADELSVSVSTVKTFKSRLLEKLSLRNVSDITRFAMKNKLIDEL